MVSALAPVLALLMTLPSADEAPAPKLKKVPDKGYSPKIGDQAVLFVTDRKGEPYDAWCATERYYYRDYMKALRIKDTAGRRELEDDGDVVDLNPETMVLVLGFEDLEIERGEVGSSRAAVVRIMSGPHKGKKFYTPDYHVARVVERRDLTDREEQAIYEAYFRVAIKAAAASRKVPKDRADRLIMSVGDKEIPAVLEKFGIDEAQLDEIVAKATANHWQLPEELRREASEVSEGKPSDADPSARPRSLLAQARALEKINKASALSYYQRIIKEYPGTDQAEAAGERIKALEKK